MSCIRGKLFILKHLNSDEVQQLSEIFGKRESTTNEIGDAGNKLMAIMYNGKSNDFLTRLRYVQWNQATATNDQLNPEKLPPTERATYFHSLRVHLEVSRAMKLNIKCPNPKNWGWGRVNNVLVPIRCDLPAAPESLLSVILCKCKTASHNICGTMLCTCRKNGLKCVPACGDCRGLSCNNA